MSVQSIYLLLYCMAYLCMIFISEMIHKHGINSEYTRKLAHIISALLTLPLYRLFPDWQYVLILVIITFLILWIGNKKKKLHSINQVGRVTHGAWLLPLGIGLAFGVSRYINSETTYLICISILALSDPLAFAGGRFFAPVKAGRGKTFAGSAVFFGSSLLISCIILILRNETENIFILTVGIAILSTIVEYFSSRGTDNITIPLFVSAYMLMVY